MEGTGDSEFQRINLWARRSAWRKFGRKALEAGVSRSEIARHLIDGFNAGLITYAPDAGPARRSIRGRNASIT